MKTPPSHKLDGVSVESVYGLDPIGFRTNEPFTIISGKEVVCRRRFGEDFSFRIKLQFGSHGERIFVEVNPILFEVTNSALEGLEVVILALDAGHNAGCFFDGNMVLFSQVVGDVSEMTDAGGKVSFPGI